MWPRGRFALPVSKDASGRPFGVPPLSSIEQRRSSPLTFFEMISRTVAASTSGVSGRSDPGACPLPSACGCVVNNQNDRRAKARRPSHSGMPGSPSLDFSLQLSWGVTLR